MKLIVCRPNHLPIRLIFPTRLLFGRLGSAILAQALRQNDIPISTADLRAQLAKLPWREWRGMCVVEVDWADGGSVRLIV